MEFPLHGKPYFLFPNVLKRWYFQKNCTVIGCFLNYLEISYFLFPKKWSYSLGGNEGWSFFKKYMQIWYFLYIRQRRYLFFLQIWFYTLSEKQRWSFPEKFLESLKNMIFILENVVFLLIEKSKMIKKFT